MFICHYNLTRAASNQHDMDSTTALCPYTVVGPHAQDFLRISSGVPQVLLPFLCVYCYLHIMY